MAADPQVMAQMLMQGGPEGPPPQGGPPPGGPPMGGGSGGPPSGGPAGGPPPQLPEAAPGPGQPMNPMQARQFLNQLGISEAALPLVAQAMQAIMSAPNAMPGVPPPGGMA